MAYRQSLRVESRNRIIKRLTYSCDRVERISCKKVLEIFKDGVFHVDYADAERCLNEELPVLLGLSGVFGECGPSLESRKEVMDYKDSVVIKKSVDSLLELNFINFLDHISPKLLNEYLIMVERGNLSAVSGNMVTLPHFDIDTFLNQRPFPNPWVKCDSKFESALCRSDGTLVKCPNHWCYLPFHQQMDLAKELNEEYSRHGEPGVYIVGGRHCRLISLDKDGYTKMLIEVENLNQIRFSPDGKKRTWVESIFVEVNSKLIPLPPELYIFERDVLACLVGQLEEMGKRRSEKYYFVFSGQKYELVEDKIVKVFT